MAEEAKVIETQPKVETPFLSPFERMQAFLNEHGEINRPAYSLTHLALWPLGFSRENTRRYFDLSITQTPTSGDIEILLNETGKEGKPKNATTQIILTNPLNTTGGKAIIRPFNHVSNVLRLSKDRWQEKKDKTGSFYTTDSDEEVTKIVDDFTRLKPIGKTGRERVGKYTEEPVVSRRGLLRLMGLGAEAIVADAFLAHIPGAPSLSKAFWEQLETATLGISPETLKKEIEDRFQIQLVSPATGVNEVEYNNEKKYPTIEWDNPRLKSLIRALSEIPPYFYSPRKINDEEHKIRFALTDVHLWELGRSSEGKYQGGFCACRAAEAQLVVLDKSQLGQTYLETSHARETWFHEVTHALTAPEIDRYIRSIVEPIGIKSPVDLWQIFSSELKISKSEKVDVYGSFLPKEFFTTDENGLMQTQVSSIHGDGSTRQLMLIGDRIVVFGEDLFLSGEKQIKEALVRDARKYAPEIITFEDYERGYLPHTRERSLGKDIAEGALFLVEVKKDNSSQKPIDYKSHIGYGAQNFYEFFSVGAEYYSQGRDKFVTTYEPYLGRERAEKLYDGVKQEIFKGKEY